MGQQALGQHRRRRRDGQHHRDAGRAGHAPPLLDEDGEPVPGAAWLRGEGGLRPDPGPAEDRRLREALEEALVEFPGCALVVSHDRCDN